MIYITLFIALVSALVVKETAYGRVQGDLINGELIKFSNIPYAAPPVKENRWRRPVHPAPWHDIYHEAKIKRCPQELSDVSKNYTEDCLYLDVYAPSKNDTELFPVMVWLQDGAHGLTSTFNAHEGNAVLVHVNYRVGIFGFLGHSEFATEDIDESTGNYGLMDQVFALRWIKQNIINFGGDPEKITLLGEGFGATGICTLLTKAETFGLYQKVVMASADCGSGMLHQSLDTVREYAERYTKDVVKCDLDILGGDRWRQCLRNASTTDLIRSPIDAKRSSFSSRIFPWTYTIDKSSAGVMDIPVNQIKRGIWARVPVMAGYNEKDGSIVIPLYTTSEGSPSKNESITALFNQFYPDNANVVAAAEDYFTQHPDDSSFGMILRDDMFKCAFRDFTLFASVDTTVYSYVVQSTKHEDIMGAILHNSDIEDMEYAWRHPFYPSHLESPISAPDQLTSTVQKYWTDFAVSENSIGNDFSDAWPKFDDRERVRYISETHQAMRQAQLSQCNFVNTIPFLWGQTTEEPGNEQESPIYSSFLFLILIFLCCILSCRVAISADFK